MLLRTIMPIRATMPKKHVTPKSMPWMMTPAAVPNRHIDMETNMSNASPTLRKWAMSTNRMTKAANARPDSIGGIFSFVSSISPPRVTVVSGEMRRRQHGSDAPHLLRTVLPTPHVRAHCDRIDAVAPHNLSVLPHRHSIRHLT